MNERMRELYLQSDTQGYFGKAFNPEKFAELIVRECIRKYQELDDAVVVYSLGEGKEVTKEQLILRHFGFEE